MNPISPLKKALLSLIALCPGFLGICQNMYPVPLEEKVQHSALVAEGKVITQESFWNPRHSMIFTSSKVELYKVFKGAAPGDTIEVMTQGGAVDGQQVEVSDLLTLRKNDIGLFFCSPNELNLQAPRSRRVLYDVYSSAQGVYKYNLATQSASAPFSRYAQVETELYPAVEKAAGMVTYTNKKPAFRVSGAGLRPGQVNAISVTSFSPAVVNAGATLDPTNNLLTITGSGFGTASGSASVFFDDPDDGSGGLYTQVMYNDPLMVSWSNTSIQVRVPTAAGTGALIVQDNLGNQATAPTTLTVNYAILTASITSGSTVTKESNLMNVNGSGGYSVFYSTSTSGGGVDLSSAGSASQRAAFQRAMATWRELAGYNIIEGTPNTTTNQVVNGSGTIMFDNTNTGVPVLPSGVLALCYSFNSMCLPVTSNEVQKTGFDIIIRNAGVSAGSNTFTSGPCPPASSSYSDIDLETVLLHELGHSLNLGHINDSYQGSTLPNINPNKLMNYAIVNGVKRSSPDYSAYQGALYAITPQGNTYGSCGLFASEMTQLSTTVETKDECPATFPSTALASGTAVAYDLVHATSNKYTDPQYTDINCAGTGTGVTNTAYYALQTGSSGLLSITVSGYTTTPAAQASCSVAGIELALYQASSCPTGQAWPAPVACRTFNANGALANITGLSTNTNYVLMADGIENTKAAFTLTFGSSSLPIKLESFDGTAYTGYNQLNWTLGLVYNVQQIDIEKSADGKTFDAIGSIPSAAISTNGTYKDGQPFMGDNYYRLAVVNLDGSKDYSTVILLKQKDAFLISAYPNPVQNRLYVDVSGVSAGSYSFALYNGLGQLVQRSMVTLSAYKQTIPLSTGGLPQGLYHLSVCNAKGIPVSELKIEVK